MSKQLSKEEFIKKAIGQHGPKYDYSLVRYDSNKTHVSIVCIDHGTFTQIPNSHMRGRGCPQCALEKISKSLSGVRDQSYPQKLQSIGIEIVGEYKGSNIHHMLKCVACGHVWKATPKSKIQNNKKYGTSGCPQCHMEEIKQASVSKIDLRGFELLEPYVDNKHKTLVKNKSCGHTFRTRAEFILTGKSICPICNTERKRNQFRQWTYDRQEEWLKTASEWQKYKSEVYILTRVSYKDHKKLINPKNLKRGRAGVEGAYHLDHIVPIRYCFENDIPPEICAHPQNLQLLHWNENVGSRDHLKEYVPPVFLEYISRDNLYEGFISTIQKNIKVTTEIHSTILSPYPLTILFPANKIGILFCPLEEYKEQTVPSRFYNKDIMERGRSQDIRLIQIYSDEWATRQDLWINKIKHILGISSIQSVVYARKCLIKEISLEEKNNLLNEFHIQGSDFSQIYIGAFYEGILLAVITFSQPRIALGGKTAQKDHYELVRFVTNTNYRIPGIASKLLSYFEQNYKWREIYSFADLRYSDGNLYHKLGFTLDKINPPGYYYIIDGQREHRWNYRKDNLAKFLSNYKPNLTEYQNMLENGYDRVWGCGTIRFIKSNT